MVGVNKYESDDGARGIPLLRIDEDVQSDAGRQPRNA